MADARQWVLHVTRNLPPLIGGMERLNKRIAENLAGRFQVVVVGPVGSRASLPASVVVREVPARSLAFFVPFAMFWTVVESIWRRPSWVVAGSGLTAPMAWLGARLVGGKALVFVHGLDLVVRHWAYQCFWIPFIRHVDVVVANSRNTAALARVRRVQEERIRVVNPGAESIAKTEFSVSPSRSLKDSLGLSGRPVLLSVGRLTPRKGVCWFVENCLAALLRRCPSILLLVVGGDANDALNAAGTSERARIEEAAKRVGVEDAIRFVPPCDDAALACAYLECDLHLFPLIEVDGDVEGFGMVAVEAAMCGLPTVAFSVGGVVDAIVPGVTGELVPPGDAEAMNDAIMRWLELGRSASTRDACVSEAARWGWSVFDRQFLRVLDEAS